MQFSSSQITCIFATILNFSIFVFLNLYLYHCICIFVSVFFYRYPCICFQFLVSLILISFYLYFCICIFLSVSLHLFPIPCILNPNILVSVFCILESVFLYLYYCISILVSVSLYFHGMIVGLLFFHLYFIYVSWSWILDLRISLYLLNSFLNRLIAQIHQWITIYICILISLSFYLNLRSSYIIVSSQFVLESPNCSNLSMNHVMYPVSSFIMVSSQFAIHSWIP